MQTFNNNHIGRKTENLWGSQENDAVNCWRGFNFKCCFSLFRPKKIKDATSKCPTPVVSINILPVENDT